MNGLGLAKQLIESSIKFNGILSQVSKSNLELAIKEQWNLVCFDWYAFNENSIILVNNLCNARKSLP